jgi:tyrosinase
MLEKAKDFGSQADRYRQAAQKFRLPYWDYFRPRAHRTTAFPGIVDNGTTSFPFDFSVPQIFTLQQIMIDLPGKGLTPQPNPLNFFNFPSGGIPDEQFNVYVR